MTKKNWSFYEKAFSDVSIQWHQYNTQQTRERKKEKTKSGLVKKLVKSFNNLV